jgi:hypothetical protein
MGLLHSEVQAFYFKVNISPLDNAECRKYSVDIHA